jgi:alpha-mannosidase
MPATSSDRRIYIANDDHTDYLWTADAETYARVFVELLDFHLALADETANNPTPYRNRFNADGSFWLWEYHRQKSPEEFARLLSRIKDGTISVPLNALVSCYGAQPAEAVLRGMAYAGKLTREHGLRFTQAVAMENQTLPLGLSSLWAGAGAKYTWRGICGCASRMDPAVWARRPHEIYWYTGLDGQRVLMKWHSLEPGGNKHSGGYAEAFDPVAAIHFLDADPGFLSRYRPPGASAPYPIRAAFGFGWDALDRKTGEPYAPDPGAYPQTEHFHIIAEAQTTPERQVIVSNQEDFFQDFEAHHGHQLPSQCVSYGNEWDLYSASMVETSARVRRAVEKLRAAEALASLVALQSPAFLKGREAARDRAFMNLGLYWEHDWTADGPVPHSERAAWQETLATELEHYVDTLHADAARALGDRIAKGSMFPAFFVFNPLGWERDVVADIAYDGPDAISVWDRTTGQRVSHQLVVLDGARYLRALARAIPSVGYCVLEIRPETGAAAPRAAAQVSADGTTLANDRIHLTIRPDGAIVRLVHEGRDMVTVANDFDAGIGTHRPVEVCNAGPVSVTVLCQSAQHTTSITVFHDSERVEIRNEIHENFADVRHWSFGFALASPVVHTEEVGAVIRVKTRAEGGDYADSHTRTDYATINHFADISAGDAMAGVTLSNADLTFVRLGESTPTRLDTDTPVLHVLAGGQVDGTGLGIPRQNGAKHFLQRFALRPHTGYAQADAMRFALEHQNPPVTGWVVGTTPSYPADRFSLLTLSAPDVLLWALKPHDDGIEQGLVARVWNQAGTERRTRLTPAFALQQATRLTHIETDPQALPIEYGTLDVAIDAHRMATFGLSLPTR